MKKRKKVIFIIITALIVLIPVIVLGINRLNEHVEYRRSRELIFGMERREREAYVRLNYAFLWGNNSIANTDDLERWSDWRLEDFASYSPFENGRGPNSFGIDYASYLALKMYELETGNILSWETVLDYHSQEFEPDGTRRLYNNGKHPEIEAFVEWMVEGNRGGASATRHTPAWVFIRRILDIQHYYSVEHEDFRFIHMASLSPQMLDALVRAYDDPNYVLDLTSLQQAGY